MDEPHNLAGPDTGLDTSGQIAQDYKLIRLLGKGGMGEVYLAEQLRVGRRQVALKLLNRSCCEDPELVKRFENEAASAGRIQHPNVVMVYESRVTSDGRLYLAMEYVEGKTLRQMIAERGTLPLSETVEITRQICLGLGTAHRLGVVHRDIKPDNIMVTPEADAKPLVKVLDFGIARLGEAVGDGTQTKTGVIMGTPYYMSPEQALGNTAGKIDLRSDIYSLAMVVYQMLTGKVAFEGDSWITVMQKHVSERPRAPSQVRPELAYLSEIEHVVLKGLEKNREDRQQTAEQFSRELQEAFQRTSGPDKASASIYEPTMVARDMKVGSAVPTVETGVAATEPPKQATQPIVETNLSTSAAETAAMPPGPESSRFWKRGKVPSAALVAAIAAAVAAAFVTSRSGSDNKAPVKATRPAPRAGTPTLQTFSFGLLGVDKTGKIVDTRRGQNRRFIEELAEGVGLEMVAIPQGSYLMGSPEAQKHLHPAETPQHEVTIRPFFITEYEITEAEWSAVARLPRVYRDLNPEPASFKGNPKLPVQNVSWLDAEEFCERLSKETGRLYRLPSEAEWEYACRAGTSTAFYFGETIASDVANYDARHPFGAAPKGEIMGHPVPSNSLAAANSFGLSHMHGNMAEWCQDIWHENYKGAPADGSAWEKSAEPGPRVVRGGSWYDAAEDCRSAARHKFPPETKLGFVGFRVVTQVLKD
jgi:formylglycine-generating enzyme required for sulfatase activity